MYNLRRNTSILLTKIKFLDFLGGSAVKNPPTMQETWVQLLVQEDLLEKGMASHSSILAWRICRDRGAWWATTHGVSRVRHNWATKPPPTPRQTEDSWLDLQNPYSLPSCGHCPILKLMTLIINQLRKINGQFQSEEYFYEVGVPRNQDIRT